MRQFRLTSLTACIALALCLTTAIPADAQSHRRGTVQTSQNRDNSSSNGRRPNANNSSRNRVNNRNTNNDNKKKQPVHNTRPNSKPAKENNVRPGNDRPKGNARPGNDRSHFDGRHHQPRPVHHGNHHVHKPKWNSDVAPPVRPHRPHFRPMPRIAPPPYWRPYHNAPIIRGILGLTFGTLYHATLDYLYDHHYDIDGYTDDIVYLRNVTNLNYRWQDVMLSYHSGRLASAQFVHSSRYHDTGRYNGVYRTLCNTYGPPISTRTLSGGGYECVWYGGNSQGMVSLEFYRHAARYYTTLTFGSR